MAPLVAAVIALGATSYSSPSGRRVPFYRVVSQIWREGLGLMLSGVGLSGLTAFASPYFAAHLWGNAGLVMTAFGIGFVFVRPALGKLPDKICGCRVVLWSLVIEALGQALVRGAPGEVVALAGALVTGLDCALIFPALGVEALRRVLPANRGSAMGAFVAFLDAAYGFAGPAAGLIAGQFGYAAVYLFGGACALFGAALVAAARSAQIWPSRYAPVDPPPPVRPNPRRTAMSRIFISGSSTGLGLMAGELLASQGHQVVLHARNAARAEHARRALPGAEAIVEGDLSVIEGAKDVAARVNDLGRFDVVIHNAAVGYRETHQLTADGLPHVFAINTLSTYILTALIERPRRLVYLSSGMHHHADAKLDDILWKHRRWNGSTAYAESKLHDTMLAFAIARRWPNVLSNALEPGWVPTKMGGPGAPDDMDQAHLTQAWLAGSDEPEAQVTGRYFYHLHPLAPNPQAENTTLQDRLIAVCAELSGIPLPG